MGDFIKWGLIAAAVIACLLLLVSGQFLGEGFTSALANIPGLLVQFLNLCSSYLVQARNLANCFILPGYEFLLTLAIGWLVTKPFFLWIATKGVKVLRAFM